MYIQQKRLKIRDLTGKYDRHRTFKSVRIIAFQIRCPFLFDQNKL